MPLASVKFADEPWMTLGLAAALCTLDRRFLTAAVCPCNFYVVKAPVGIATRSNHDGPPGCSAREALRSFR